MGKEKIFVDYGKYQRCGPNRYWEILQEERIRGVRLTWHHVFTRKLINGAWQKNGLTKNQLEGKYKRYGLDMDEGTYLAASIHSVLNQLLRNCSPPVILVNIGCIFESRSMSRSTKIYFTKLILYLVEEKFERRIKNREYRSLEEINDFIENIRSKSDIIEKDINDGNRKDAEFIMALFGVTREEIIHFINKNFFPANWTNYPSDLWDLYLV